VSPRVSPRVSPQTLDKQGGDADGDVVTTRTCRQSTGAGKRVADDTPDEPSKSSRLSAPIDISSITFG